MGGSVGKTSSILPTQRNRKALSNINHLMLLGALPFAQSGQKAH
jgi:hypothetical protein